MGKDADKENNRNKFKKVLLSCLDDADVRDAILSIQNSAPVELDDSKLRELEHDLQESQQSLRGKKRELEEMQRQYQLLQGELADYKGMLTKAQNENIVLNNDKKKLQQSIDSLAGENKHLQSELSSAKSELQGVKSELSNTKSKLQSARSELQNVNSTFQGIFWHGMDIHQRYCSVVSEKSRGLLEGVFHGRTDFESFIASLSQSNCLCIVWDAMRDCVMHGRADEVEVLWDVFKLAIELVNSAKSERIYELLETSEGEKFNYDEHSIVDDSKNQGRIRDIYLHGYMNIYSGDVERKSLVFLGD